MLLQPLMQALAISFLSVMEGGRWIKLKTVIDSLCLEVCIFSLPFLFLYFGMQASINGCPLLFCVL